ncbi:MULTISPECIES: M20 family metallopeptidase [Microbacterium]|uniref:M20 family metallopeptidase n=1 Tax=Microbacterium TaxID=33882 RepID=UPI0021A96F9D|nr:MULTISPECIES: M20 family metallopeptidase [Microbacterium]MCT1365674.1 M20 family metallopeptidase [Microbacterium sp. p3-SID131]MCT1377822.1 M20 family metallopeptidase [Microbacterium sp. p3-SID337]MCZ0710727.1 M20 family metallopeptidase [Microbacterium paraoxydans]
MTTPSAVRDADHPSDDIIALVRELVLLETPSRDVEASGRIADLLSAWFAGVGGTVQRVPHELGTDLVIDVLGTGDPVLLIGHTDTVWPVGTLAHDLPWSEEGDVVRGPGSYDMKAGIVVMLETLRRLQPLPLAQRRAVRIVLVADEEIGSPVSGPLLAERARGAACAIGFESPHPDGALKVGRRGSARVRIAVTGRAAHAALDPEHGVSAIDELVDQLLRVRAIVADPDLPSPVLCNVGVIDGGARTNVVPAQAAAEIGLRFLDPDSEERVLAALRGLTPVRPGAHVEVAVLSARPAWRASAADATFLARIAEEGAALGQHVDGRPAAGAGDTNLLGGGGIPTVDGLGPRGGGAHAVDEHFLRSSLHERIALLRAVLTIPTE